MLKIYKRGGGQTDENIRCEVGKYEYNGALSGERSVSFSLSSPVPIEWEAGDYLVLRGETFTLISEPSKKKQARANTYGAAFVYDNVRFDGITSELKIALFLDYVKDDNKEHYTGQGTFSFYLSKVEDFADRLLANLDRKYGAGEWDVVVLDGEIANAQAFGVSSGTSLLQALTTLSTAHNINYHVKTNDGKKTIYLGGDAVAVDGLLRYGKGKGMKSVSKNTNGDGVITRLHVYGSTRNLPYRYYNKRYKQEVGDTRYMNRLMLPLRYWKKDGDVYDVFVDSRAENFTDAGITDHKAALEYDESGNLVRGAIVEGEHVFDSDDGEYKEIYPSLEGATVDNSYRAGMTMYEEGYSTDATMSGVLMSFVKKISPSRASLFTLETAKTYAEKIRYDTDAKKYITADASVALTRDGWDDEMFGMPNISKLGTNRLDKYLNPYINSIDFNRATTVEGADNGLKHELTESEKQKIKSNSYGGKLDAVTGTSTDEDGNVIKDNGVSGTGLYDDGDKDTSAAGATIYSDFYVTIAQIGFNVEDFVAYSGEKPTLCMKTGMCAGRSFEIARCMPVDEKDYSKGWRLRCQRDKDDSVNMVFPNCNYLIRPGDTFVLTGIDMPGIYVEMAENRLFVQAMKWLAEHDHARETYTPELDSKWLAEHEDVASSIVEGMALTFSDRDAADADADLGFAGESVSVTITHLNIKYGNAALPEYSVTLSDDPKQQSVIDKLSAASRENADAIANAGKKSQKSDKDNKNLIIMSRAAAGTGGAKELGDLEDMPAKPALKPKYFGINVNGEYAWLETIDDMFTKVVVASHKDADGNDVVDRYAIRANYDLYSVGDVSAYGIASEIGGGGEGASYFSELLDVIGAGAPSVAAPYWGWNGTRFGWIAGDGKGSDVPADVLTTSNYAAVLGGVYAPIAHVGNADVHVTADDRSKWNGKQDALTAGQLAKIANALDKTTADGYYLGKNVKAADSAKLNGKDGDTYLRVYSADPWKYIRPTIDNSALLNKSYGDGWVEWWLDNGRGYINHELGKIGINTHRNLDKDNNEYVADTAFMVYGNSYLTGTLRIGNIVLSATGNRLTVANVDGTNVAHICASGDVVAYGIAAEGGSGGAKVLNDLDDVTISNPSSRQALVYDGTKWVNGLAGLSEGEIAAYLTDNRYATQNWVSSNYQPKGNYLTQHQSLAGYAKTEDVVTSVSACYDDGKSLSWWKGSNKQSDITIPYASKAGQLSKSITLWGIGSINGGSEVSTAPNLYIGTTKVQTGAAFQVLTGIKDVFVGLNNDHKVSAIYLDENDNLIFGYGTWSNSNIKTLVRGASVSIQVDGTDKDGKTIKNTKMRVRNTGVEVFAPDGNNHALKVDGSIKIGDIVLAVDGDRLTVTNSASGKVAHVCASGDVVAYGVASEIGGGGASVLNDLDDVTIGTVTDKQVLVYDAATRKWINGDAGLDTAGVNALIGQYLSQNGYLTSAVTSFGGANGAITVRGGLTANGSVNLAMSGKQLQASIVGLGSMAYKSSLAAADIPGLPWGIIISGKPTTISGYGITDAFTEATANTKYVSAIGVNGDNITWTKNGSVNSITAPYAGYTKLLKKHSDATDLNNPEWSDTGLTLQNWSKNAANEPTTIDNANILISIGSGNHMVGYKYGWQMAFMDNNNAVYMRRLSPSGVDAEGKRTQLFSAWRQLAFMDSTIANASSLGGVAASGYVTVSGTQDISGAKTFTSGSGVTLKNDLYLVGGSSAIRLQAYDGKNYIKSVASFDASKQDVGNANLCICGPLVGSIPEVRIVADKVGIGNVTPTKKLHVLGDAMISDGKNQGVNLNANGGIEIWQGATPYIDFKASYGDQNLRLDNVIDGAYSVARFIGTRKTSALSLGGGAKVYWDTQNSAWRFEGNIIASGDVVAYGGVGTLAEIGDLEVTSVKAEEGRFTKTAYFGDMLVGDGYIMPSSDLMVYVGSSVAAKFISGCTVTPMIKIGAEDADSITSVSYRKDSGVDYICFQINGKNYRVKAETY